MAKLTKQKAAQMLHDKTAHGKPLTDKQRKYFGAVANGKKGIKVDPMGYWNPENQGKPVIIPSNQITMQGVDFPVLGIADNGKQMVMYPYQNYDFQGAKYVTEYPLAKSGKKLNKLGVENSLWNNIRAKAGSGKKPTKEMLNQEKKIKAKAQDGTQLPPIYTNDPKDPRLKAYNDSLSLYKNNQNILIALNKANYNEKSPIQTIKKNFSNWNFAKNQARTKPNTTGLKSEGNEMYSVNDFIPSTVNKNLPKQLFSDKINPAGTRIFYKSSVYGNNIFHPKIVNGRPIDELVADDENWFTAKPDYRVVADYRNVYPQQPVIYKPSLPIQKVNKKPVQPVIYQQQPDLNMVGTDRPTTSSFMGNIPAPVDRSIAPMQTDFSATWGENGKQETRYFPNFNSWKTFDEMRMPGWMHSQSTGDKSSGHTTLQGMPKFQDGGQVPWYTKRQQGDIQLPQSVVNAPVYQKIDNKKAEAARRKTTIGQDTRNAQQKKKDEEAYQRRLKYEQEVEGKDFITPTSLQERNRAQSERIIHNLVDVPTTVMGTGELVYGVGKFAAKQLPKVGEYLTTQTPLRNTYKINPWAFKHNPEAYYRGIGKSGFDQALETGVVGPRPNSVFGQDVHMSSMFDVAEQYSKDYYNPFNKNFYVKGSGNKIGYIAEIPRTSLTNPNSPFPYNVGTKEHPIYFHEFKNPKSIPLNEVKLLKQDWLRGYKEVPKPTSSQQITREFIDWADTPGFMERNPQFNPRKYENWVKSKTDFSTPFDPDMTIQEFFTGGKIDNMQQAKSGIHIKESKKGTFTAAAKKHGKGVQEFARQVLANKENYSPAMVKKANFAHVFGGRNYEFGGYIVNEEYEITEKEAKRLKDLGYDFDIL